MTAREEFNKMLNSCYSPRAVYNSLFALAANPNVKKTDNVNEKRAVIDRQLNTVADKAGLNESIEQAV